MCSVLTLLFVARSMVIVLVISRVRVSVKQSHYLVVRIKP